MTIKLIETAGSDTYWHFTDSDLKPGVTYKARPATKLYFGDFEKLLHKYRPAGAASRLNAFYMTKSKDFAGQFGSHACVVTPVGKHSACAVGWMTVLMSEFMSRKMVKGFKKDYGYTLSSVSAPALDFAKKCVAKYYAGVPPSSKELKFFEADPDSETKIIEILAPVMKVIRISQPRF